MLRYVPIKPRTTGICFFFKVISIIHLRNKSFFKKAIFLLLQFEYSNIYYFNKASNMYNIQKYITQHKRSFSLDQHMKHVLWNELAKVRSLCISVKVPVCNKYFCGGAV